MRDLLILGPYQAPLIFGSSQVPNVARVSYTSSIPEYDVGNYSGLDSTGRVRDRFDKSFLFPTADLPDEGDYEITVGNWQHEVGAGSCGKQVFSTRCPTRSRFCTGSLVLFWY